MTVVRADWPAPARVHAFTTTRAGGVSKPPYDSLNLGLHVGDDERSVRRNRERLRAEHGLPGEPLWLRQVHGVEVVSSASVHDDVTADGSWTVETGRVLAVMTADCLPVVLSDAAGSRVAVVHAGWRGLAAGILERAVGAFASGGPLHAWLGPAIGPAAFEVGPEVRRAFIARRDAHASAFRPSARGGHFLADLYAIARRELADASDVTVSGGDRCTFEETDTFYSHRRDGAASGRMATVAWLAK